MAEGAGREKIGRNDLGSSASSSVLSTIVLSQTTLSADATLNGKFTVELRANDRLQFEIYSSATTTVGTSRIARIILK